MRFALFILKKGARATCNCSVSMCKVTAAARVFRVRGSSFLEKTWLDSLKKRVQSKKSFHLSSKKSGARVTCTCGQLLRPQASIGCCGLSFSITGLIFSGKMRLGTPKKRVKSKKSFHLSSKTSGARVTRTCSGRKHQSAAAG